MRITVYSLYLPGENHQEADSGDQSDMSDESEDNDVNSREQVESDIS